MGVEVLAFAALAGTLASTGMAVFGQMQQGNAAKSAAKYNERALEYEAQNKQKEAHEQGVRAQIRKRKNMGDLRNTLSGRGTLTTTGAPLEILGESSSNMQLQIADAYRQSQMEAAAFRAQGQMGLWEAEQYKRASTFSAIGTGLQGISSAVSGYSDFKYKGVI